LFYSAQERGGGVFGLDYLTKPVGTAELGHALQRQGLSEDDKSAKTILIVDDDAGLLDMHAEIVRSHSKAYRILKARNGKEALSMIQQERPDLVLLDLIMPEMDGFGVLEAMQQQETTRHIPVVVLTGQILTQEEMARLNRGVTAVLSKGVFTVEETLAHVQHALATGRGSAVETRQLVRKAMAYIHRYYAEPLSREKIARHVCVTENYLTRCFQQELHVPPMTYLTRYRINQAKALLDSGTMNVAAVAAAVGFSSEFYFNRVFRREVGLAPGAYRRGRRNSG
jgi:YesN/AraC family two-component response regulator